MMQLILSVAITTVGIKVLWHLTGMGEWTGLGPLPWGAALFLGLFDLIGGWTTPKD